jgi:hypothetical protein
MYKSLKENFGSKGGMLASGQACTRGQTATGQDRAFLTFRFALRNVLAFLARLRKADGDRPAFGRRCHPAPNGKAASSWRPSPRQSSASSVRDADFLGLHAAFGLGPRLEPVSENGEFGRRRGPLVHDRALFRLYVLDDVISVVVVVCAASGPIAAPPITMCLPEEEP